MFMLLVFRRKIIKFIAIEIDQLELDPAQVSNRKKVPQTIVEENPQGLLVLEKISKSCFSVINNHLKQTNKAKVKEIENKILKVKNIRIRGESDITINSDRLQNPVKVKSLFDDHSLVIPKSDEVATGLGDGIGAIAYSCDDRQIVKDLDDSGMKKPGTLDSKEDEKCYVCFEEEPDAVIMDCGHGGICLGSAEASWQKDGTCLICRQPITTVLKVKNLEGLGVSKVVQVKVKKLEEA
jgi:hypothetical protein